MEQVLSILRSSFTGLRLKGKKHTGGSTATSPSQHTPEPAEQRRWGLGSDSSATPPIGSPGNGSCCSVNSCSSSSCASSGAPLAACSSPSSPHSPCSTRSGPTTAAPFNAPIASDAPEPHPSPSPACAPGDVIIDDQLKAELKDTIMHSGGIAAVFDAGEPLGEGGEGEVRRVELGGNSYAAKRYFDTHNAVQDCDNAAALPSSPWVLCPAFRDLARSPDGAFHYYSIMPLALGDLTDLLLGAEACARARNAPAAAGGNAATQCGGQQPPAPAAGARAAFKRGMRKLVPSCLKRPKVHAGAALPAAAASAQEPNLPMSQANALAAEAILAVGAIHAAGKVHHDIKTANLLIAKDSHVAICDLSMLSNAHEATAGGGTPSYAAPEVPVTWCQQAGSAIRACMSDALKLQVDERPQDIWSLGVTLLHVFLPLEEATAAKAKFERTGRWVLPAWVPEQLRDLLLCGMLRRNPRKRLTIDGVKSHPWFAGVDWAAVEARRGPPPVADAAALIAAALAPRPTEAAAAAAAMAAGGV